MKSEDISEKLEVLREVERLSRELFEAAYQVELGLDYVKEYAEIAEEGLDRIDRIQKELEALK